MTPTNTPCAGSPANEAAGDGGVSSQTGDAGAALLGDGVVLFGGNVNASHILRELSRACDKCGGQSAFARKHGLSPQYICDVLRGHREITDTIANAVGFIRQITFIPARKPQ